MQCQSEVKVAIPAMLWAFEPPQPREIDAPERLLVPLSSHADVAVQVKEPGTLLARGDALVHTAPASGHVPIAPLDGQLGTTRTVMLTNGRMASAVELIAGPGRGAERDSSPQGRVAQNAGNDVASTLVNWIDRLRGNGIWADRRDSPDLIGQLNQIVSRPIDTIICTALDADANLRLNAALAAVQSDAIVAGLAQLLRVTGAGRGIVAVEAFARPSWIMPLRTAVRAAGLEIVELNNDYPQADPTLMLYSLTGRRLRPGNLPTTQGVLLLDAAPALAIGRSSQGEPATRTPLAIHDHQRKQSHFLSVAVGTPLAFVLAQLQMKAEGMVLRGGDLLRDVRLATDAVAGGGELTIHVTPAEASAIPEPCIRCAWCLEACPTLVQPAGVLEAAQRRHRGLAERAGIAACIECGLCTHVCPSGLPLLESIRQFRGLMANDAELSGWER